MASTTATLQQQALLVWNNGNPMAKGIPQARAEWAPYLDMWAAAIEKGALKDTPVVATKMGWINNDMFWARFWNTWEEQKPGGNFFIKCSEGALAAQSKSFFNTMPPSLWKHLQSVTLRNTDILVDPDMLLWFSDEDDIPTKRQWSKLRDLQWIKTNNSPIVSVRPGVPPKELIDMTCRNALRHELVAYDLQDVLGHLFINGVPQGQARKALEQIKATMGVSLPEQCDLELIALCSGHDVTDSLQDKPIASLGRNLNRTRGPLEQEGCTFAGMIGLLDNPVACSKDLYNTITRLELRKPPEAGVLPIDNSLFASPML